MFPQFLENKPVNRLFDGDGSLCATYFNDDSLGRGLDEVFKFGVTKLFSELAFDIGITLNLLSRSAHFDTTSISLYGDYLDSDKTPIDVT